MQFASELLNDKGRKVHSIDPDATVLDAIREMDQHHVGALLVLENGRLVGVISERDYARRVILKGRRSGETKVREIMTTELHTTSEHASIDECMAIMNEQRVRHLPVLEADEVVGVLSIGDLVRVIIQRQRNTIEALKDYITH